MTHVPIALVFLCGIVSSANALCGPGTYFMDSVQACGVCPAGEFATEASTLPSRRQGVPATPSPTCGRTIEDTVGCSKAPQGVEVQTCATDVYNMMQPSPGTYDWAIFSISIQSAVMGKDGRIFLLLRETSGSFYVFNTHDNSMQKIPSAIAKNGFKPENMAGCVYVEASETIYWLPYERNEIHVLRMQNVNNLQIEVLRAIPAKTDATWDQLFGSPVLVGTSIYFPPMDADYTLVLHIAPDFSTTYEQKFWNTQNAGNMLLGKNKFIIGVLAGDQLVFVPRDRDHVAIIDVSQANLPMHEVAVPSDLTGILFKYSDGVLANDGFIYLAQCTAPYFAKIDPLTGLITKVDVRVNGVPWTRPGDIRAIGCIYSSLVQGKNHKLYFAPEMGKYVFEMDLNDISASKEITEGGILFGFGDVGLYSSAILANNGLIYLVPSHVYPSTNLHDENYNYFDTVPVTAICAPELSQTPGLVCTPCSSNSFSLEGDAECTCNPGYGKSLLGDSCSLCTAGKFSTAGGSGMCQNCKENSYSGDGSQSCLCNAGFSLSNYDVCVECEVGKYKP